MTTRALLPLVLSLGLASAAFAADATGTVVSISDTEITLRLDDGTQVTYPVANDVSVRVDSGEPITLAQLEQKRVDVSLDADRRATSIEVVAAAEPEVIENQGTLTSERAREVARNELPATASHVPLAGLIGGIALAGAFAIRMLRSRRR
jgi:hypothetical protein